MSKPDGDVTERASVPLVGHPITVSMIPKHCPQSAEAHAYLPVISQIRRKKKRLKTKTEANMLFSVCASHLLIFV